jgi:signal transduction histidine kinase
MTFRFALLLVLSLCLCSHPHVLSARDKHYDIVNYNTDNGLPQNSITAIQFDRKGYCWLGTQMGLVRFDGRRFSLFSSDNIKGLRSDRIYSITRDTAGSIFVSTWGIVNVLKINDTLPGVASTPVLTSLTGHDFPLRGFVSPITFANTEKTSSDHQWSLGTASGEMYLTQNSGIYYVTAHKKIRIADQENYSDGLMLIGESLVLLRSPDKVAVWIKGIEQRPPVLRGPLWTNPYFNKGIYSAPVNTDGNYVYAGGTLYQLSFSNDTLYSEVLLEGLTIPDISSIYVDKPDNRFYLGSPVSGLFIVTRSDFYTPATPANNFIFYSQAVTEEGIFCQNILFRKDGTHKEYRVVPNLKAILYSPQDKGIYHAPGLNLLRLDLATGKTHIIAALPSSLSSIFPDAAHTGYLIVSTSFSMGKLVRDTIRDQKNVSGLTKDQALMAVYPAGKDTFLLATWGGVKWYDYANNRIYRSILDSLLIRQLYVETSQRIWIASYGKGWYRYDKGKVTRMPDGPRDALKTVNAIIDDGRGCFWLSSNNGLFKVSKQALANYQGNASETIYFYTFNTRNHLPTNEFNASNPSFVWLPDSMLSLPTIKGLVWFYPHKIQLSLPDRGIYIDHININQKELQHLAAGLSLDPDHGTISLQVSSPYFGNKENMQLEYRIEGLNEEWRAVSENGTIEIDRLPAGHYNLVIKKKTGMEPGQYTSIRLPVQVHPYWYNTRLFYTFLLLFTIALILWLTKLRTRVLRTRNRKLKKQVALQTRNLNHMIRQLTQSEEALKESNQAKDNIITTVLHDLRSPIRFIYTISKHIAAGHRKMQQDKLDLHLKELKNSTASLNSFTDQFFTWALSQHRSFAAKYTRESLADLFRETEMLYTDIMSANSNRLIVTPTELYCYSDPQLLSTVVRNLLDNANKYTRDGVIKLSAIQPEHQTIITVSDTGSGFSPEALKAFLNKDKTDPRNGRGSFIILYLLELIGGRLEADSEPGKGTTFRIVLSHHDAAPGSTPAG